MRICEMKTYRFNIHLRDEDDCHFEETIGFETKAPCYEMAVAQALATGQSILRENDEERTLFMRITYDE
jgi:hypothetical protein